MTPKEIIAIRDQLANYLRTASNSDLLNVRLSTALRELREQVEGFERIIRATRKVADRRPDALSREPTDAVVLSGRFTNEPTGEPVCRCESSDEFHLTYHPACPKHGS